MRSAYSGIAHRHRGRASRRWIATHRLAWFSGSRTTAECSTRRSSTDDADFPGVGGFMLHGIAA